MPDRPRRSASRSRRCRARTPPARPPRRRATRARRPGGYGRNRPDQTAPVPDRYRAAQPAIPRPTRLSRPLVRPAESKPAVSPAGAYGRWRRPAPGPDRGSGVPTPAAQAPGPNRRTPPGPAVPADTQRVHDADAPLRTGRASTAPTPAHGPVPPPPAAPAREQPPQPFLQKAALQPGPR